MKGDFTRSTFHPEKKYSSVRMQQGRVQLDADWNEQVDIEEYLRETALADIIGPCGAPKDENGGGFKVELADGGANLTFSAGRIYVDGILCENGETRRLTEQEEDHPGFALPAEAAGTWVVYLDVWQRHITALEDDEIREHALGGPDTATRTRTTCQVKMVPVPPGTECPDEPQAWLDEIAAPTGTMRARTRPADFDPNPCAVPPAAGFTRLENQLYRVEVHRGGELGGPGPQPTFKWSRDNGSVVSRWLATDGAEVTVESLGRDSVLTLEGARWVELTDDLDELAIEPGQLAEVSATGESSLTVAPAPGAPNLARNAKVRRWDMPGPGGAVPITQAPDDDSWTSLEGGIQVDFDPGTYRTGDYWQIPARAFIGEHAGDIEWPAEGGGPAALLPQGIEHHYCKLAVVTKSGGVFVDVEDCRDDFCPLTESEPGCCTVVVEPGDDIQAAIDSVLPEGGCVCLKTGEHLVSDPIRIGGSNVTLHGESLGAVVRGTRTFQLLQVGQLGSPTVENVVVEGIRFVSVPVQVAAGVQAVVSIDDAESSVLRHCGVEVEGLVFGTAVRLGGCRRVAVEGCALAGTSLGVHVDTDSTELAIRENRVLAAATAQVDVGSVGVWVEDAYGPTRVEGNHVAGFMLGIVLNSALTGVASSGARRSVVAGNRVFRGMPAEPGEDRLYGIDVAASDCAVQGNVVFYAGPTYAGIRASGSGARVEGNRIFSNLAPTTEEFLSVGIVVGLGDEEVPGFGDGTTVAANRITGFQDGIWVAGSDRVSVLDNLIGDPSRPLRGGILLTGSSFSRARGNQIHTSFAGILALGGEGNRVEANRMTGGLGGVGVLGETDLSILENIIENTQGPGIAGNEIRGATAVRGNRLVSCVHAPGDIPPFALGLISDDSAGSVEVEANTVVDSGVSADGEIVHTPAGGIGVIARACTVHANRVFYERLAGMAQQAGTEGRALFLLGLWRLEGQISVGQASLPYEIIQSPANALVSDNSFHGTGLSALVEIVHLSFPLTDRFAIDLGFGEVTFSANHCLHFHAPDEATAHRTVALGGRRAVVLGNHVRSARPLTSFDFTQAGSVVYTGNFTTGGTLAANNFPPPESDHNRP